MFDKKPLYDARYSSLVSGIALINERAKVINHLIEWIQLVETQATMRDKSRISLINISEMVKRLKEHKEQIISRGDDRNLNTFDSFCDFESLKEITFLKTPTLTDALAKLQEVEKKFNADHEKFKSMMDSRARHAMYTALGAVIASALISIVLGLVVTLCANAIAGLAILSLLGLCTMVFPWVASNHCLNWVEDVKEIKFVGIDENDLKLDDFDQLLLNTSEPQQMMGLMAV